METFSSVFRTSHERRDLMRKEAGYKERKEGEQNPPQGEFCRATEALVFSPPVAMKHLWVPSGNKAGQYVGFTQEITRRSCRLPVQCLHLC